VCINSRLHCLSSGTLIFIPKGARHADEEYVYLVVDVLPDPFSLGKVDRSRS
jgi:hypothetical protein